MIVDTPFIEDGCLFECSLYNILEDTETGKDKKFKKKAYGRLDPMCYNSYA